MFARAFLGLAITSNPVPTKRNPPDAKGAGEAGTIGALPAIVNAVVGALASLGVKGLDMPATSERIRQALRARVPDPAKHAAS